MKQRFWLFKRGSVFYLQDSKTGRKDSLGTRDPKQAERLRAAKTKRRKSLCLVSLGKAYLPPTIEAGAQMGTGHGRVRSART
jgi:hypothetical protein